MMAACRVAHDSFVNRLLGLPWQRVIKYHRWCGQITLMVLYLHGGLTWISWLLEHSFRDEVCPSRHHLLQHTFSVITMAAP